MSLSSLDKIRQIRKGMGNPALGEITDEDIAIYLHLAMKQLATIHEFESRRRGSQLRAKESGVRSFIFASSCCTTPSRRGG